MHDESRLLRPILVTGMGRSGSTLAMSLVGGDRRCAFDKQYPMESRYLSRIAFFAAQWSGWAFDGQEIERRLGKHPVLLRPWADPSQLISIPGGGDMLLAMWRTFGQSVRSARPDAEFYAEKVAEWVPPFVAQFLDAFALYLFRDPRDYFLSANAINCQRGYLSFGRKEADSDRDFALTVAFHYLQRYESYRVFQMSGGKCSLTRYEDLVRDPRSAFADLTRETGLDPVWTVDNDLYPEHKTTQSVQESIERWKRQPISEEVLAVFEDKLFAFMQELGYENPRCAPHSRELDFDFADGEHADRRIVSIEGACRQTTGNAGLELETGGSSFEVVLEIPATEAADIQELWLCLAGDYGSQCEISWANARGEFLPDRSLLQTYNAGRRCSSMRLAVGTHPLWTGVISRLKLKVSHAQESYASTRHCHIRWLKVISGAASPDRRDGPATGTNSVIGFFRKIAGKA